MANDADRIARCARARRSNACRRLRTADAVFRKARRIRHLRADPRGFLRIAANGRYGADADTLLYNGPFRITTWVHGAHLRMEKNPSYWDADRIRLECHRHAVRHQRPERSGQSVQRRQDRHRAAECRDARQTRSNTAGRSIASTTDRSSTPSSIIDRAASRRNLNLRRALALVSDPGELVYKVMKLPGNMPGVSLFPAWLPGVNGYFRQEYPPEPPRVDIARGAPLSRPRETGTRDQDVPPLVLLTGDDPLSSSQAEYFQNVFKRTLGLDVKIDKQIFKQRLAKMTAGEFDMVAGRMGPRLRRPADVRRSVLVVEQKQPRRCIRTRNSIATCVSRRVRSIRRRAWMRSARSRRSSHDDVVIIPSYERGIVYVRDPRLKGIESPRRRRRSRLHQRLHRGEPMTNAASVAPCISSDAPLHDQTTHPRHHHRLVHRHGNVHRDACGARRSADSRQGRHRADPQEPRNQIRPRQAGARSNT